MTHIRYELAKDGPVRLSIYNIRGQHAVTMVHRKQRTDSYEVDGMPASGYSRERWCC